MGKKLKEKVFFADILNQFIHALKLCFNIFFKKYKISPVPKNQHYIPKSILRHWSNDTKTINIWLGKNGAIKRNASISDQFKKRYLYGKTTKIETKLFANDIEPNMINFIKKIRKKGTIIGDKRPQKFVLYSLFRTKFFIELNCYNITKISSFVCKDAHEFGFDMDKIKTETLKALDLIDGTNKIKGYEDMFYQYNTLWPIIKTLRKATLLRTNKELVIGEIPVVFICPFNSRIIDPLFIISYPISPKELLVLYRPEDGNVDENRILTDSETHILNSYQFQQTEDIIAFHDELQIDFDKDENMYDPLDRNRKLKKFPLGDGPDDFILLPHTIQDFHFYYDEGLRSLINPKNK